MSSDAMVLVVDDDRAVRTGLCRILRAAGHEVEAFDGAGPLLERLRSLDGPCCLVSDVRMPGMDGLALQDALAAARAPVAVVFLTAYADVQVALTAMKHGAIDLLEKPVSGEALLDAVAAGVRSARRACERHHRVEDLRARHATLTRRERQVFALVTAGLLNKQVGFELGTSEKTVKVQRARVIEKMGARSLADLVRMADLLGLAPEQVEAAPAAQAVPAAAAGAR